MSDHGKIVELENTTIQTIIIFTTIFFGFESYNTTYELFFDYRSSHIRPHWLILFHRCGSTTPSSKKAPLETNLKPPPMKLFQNPDS